MTLLLLNLESLPNGIHICGFTDSSSALGWMHHSTFDPVKYPSHDIVARQLAMDLISSRSSLFSQHIKGSANVIADALSRDFHLSDSLLIQMIQFVYKQQVPENFTIYPLQEEIIYWLESIKVPKTHTMVLPKKHVPSNLDHLALGNGFYPNAKFRTPSYKNLEERTKLTSSVLLRSPSETMSLAKRLNLPSMETQSLPPSTMWQRPSGRKE